MKTIATLAAAALALAACVEKDDPASAYRNALPQAQAIQLGTPQAQGTAGALTVRTDAAASSAPPSEYAVLSHRLATIFNGGVGWVLEFAHLVTTYPPTACDDASCTWGPWVDGDGLNRWKLAVSRAGDAYDWVLSAQPGSRPSAAFVALIGGSAVPAARGRGHGTFSVDFDAQDGLDHGQLWVKKDFGKLDVTYDDRTDLSIDALFTGARDQTSGHRLDVAYAFAAARSGGELQLAMHDLDTTEVIGLRTRWGATGQGRADGHYTGPDGAGGRVDLFASQCWAGASEGFAETYDSQHPELGPESACSPFDTASYADLTLP